MAQLIVYDFACSQNRQNHPIWVEILETSRGRLRHWLLVAGTLERSNSPLEGAIRRNGAQSNDCAAITGELLENASFDRISGTNRHLPKPPTKICTKIVDPRAGHISSTAHAEPLKTRHSSGPNCKFRIQSQNVGDMIFVSSNHVQGLQIQISSPRMIDARFITACFSALQPPFSVRLRVPECAT